MEFLIPLFSEPAFFYPPQSFLGWALWVVWWGIILLALRRWRSFDVAFSKDKGSLFFGLLVATIFSALVFGIRLPAWGALALPHIPAEPRGPILMIFAAVPWFLAAGFLGPKYASSLALISGFLIGLLDNHNPYYFLEMAFLGSVLGALLRQRYRTRFYKMIRHPLAAAFLLTLLYAIIYPINASFLPMGSLVERLDYAISNLRPAVVAAGAAFFVGGLAGEVFVLLKVRSWGGHGALEPSPAERSLQARFFYTMIPIGLVVVLVLIVGDWIVSGNAARQMLRDRMSTSVGTSVQGIPFFLEAGQDLIQQISDDPRLYTVDLTVLPVVLRENLRRVPFFSQLIILDADGDFVAGFPAQEYGIDEIPLDEQEGIDLALNGIRVQSYAIPPKPGMQAAQVSFMANILDESQSIQGVVIGHVDLEANPFTQPILASLNGMADVDGQGYLLDEKNRILYSPTPDLLMTEYPGMINLDEPFQDQTSSDGTRSLVYYQQAIGRPWASAIWVPAQQSQQLSLQFAAPLLAMVILLAGVTVLMADLGIRGITNSLQNLANESDRIAQGQLDNSLTLDGGGDEVGQLRRSFEQMRRSLKARLDELNLLLAVSEGVASSLDLEESLLPVLRAGVSSGANSARIVLAPDTFPELAQTQGTIPTRYGEGISAARYEDLDDQVLILGRDQDQLILTNPARVRVLRFESEERRPQAMAIFAMRHENQYYGVFWCGYDIPHVFSEEEIRFLTTLTSQAALAAANANLFLSAEVGRQRLAAILESTPDPIMVTDAKSCLLLVNPAARKVFAAGGLDLMIGQAIDQSGQIPDLVALLRVDGSERQSAEIHLPDERTYLAIASSTLMNGQRSGRVCVMRDVTEFKQLDELKSEFVSTVSHDLRSPLTLIRGYATMLPMVGELNDQQSNYARKIIVSIEGMSKLVNNLLDLGRIEAGVGLQLELIPVREVVDQVISALQHQAIQKQIDLTVHFPDGIEPIVEADQALFQQALQNLVENAIKYTDASGRVDVRFEVRQDNAVFVVSDTGIGIAPVDQSRLFEKFYRVARRGATQTRGTGLGLAIVKSIAERHGGRVWVESQLGRGSTFTFLIPLRQRKLEDGRNSKGIPINKA